MGAVPFLDEEALCQIWKVFLFSEIMLCSYVIKLKNCNSDLTFGVHKIFTSIQNLRQMLFRIYKLAEGITHLEAATISSSDIKLFELSRQGRWLNPEEIPVIPHLP